MKITLKALVTLTFFFIQFTAGSQEIDYSYAQLSTTSCNIFASATDVANYEHLTALSRPKYADNSVLLECKTNNSTSVLSSIYSIKYSFKTGYNYKISVYYKGIKDVADGFYPSVGIKTSTANGGTASGTDCVSPSVYSKDNMNTFVQSASGSNYGWVLNLISFTATSNSDYLLVGAFPHNSTLYLASIYVRKIQITETPPPASFTLAPASLNISCGSATPQTFTVTNVNNTTGVTNYVWNLGSANNGWLYNGTAAPQTISTGTANTITLTPICGGVQQNISATVTASGNNYTTNASTISKTIPSLSISGSDVLCSGTEMFTINGLPCGATITWTSSDPAIASVTSSGNPATVTKVGNGVITLSAVVNTCGTQTNLTPKAIAVGTLPAPEKLYFNGFTIPGTPCLGGEEDYEVAVHNPLPGASYWWTVTGAGDFRFGQGDPNVGITTQPEPGGYMYVDVQPENGCGTGDMLSLSIQICGDGLMVMENAFIVSPNPATDMITIQKVANASSQKTKQAIEKAVINEVRVFDNAGNLKKQLKFGKGTSSSQLNLAGLKEGLYYVEIINGKLKERHQLLIKK